MIVADLMNKNPATIQPGANLAQALEEMAAKKTRHLIVISEADAVAGILSDRDLAMYYDPGTMTQQKWEQATVES
ncbi:MAG: CBS domain-containing protein, partial [SAR324 cluster bacterium]|nr:CBS domain-containing protein [SAR324 cluster bacterium]